MESGVDVFNDNLPKYKPSFANRNDSFLEILVSKPILSIPYDLTPLFNNAITSFSCIIEHLCLSLKLHYPFPVFGNQATFQFSVLFRDF